MNTRFHLSIAEFSGSQSMLTLLRQVAAKIEWLYALDVAVRGEHSWAEHAEIAEQVSRGRVREAVRLMGRHIDNSMEGFLLRHADADPRAASAVSVTADRLSVALMLALSFGTGILDAATYLGLHGVFTANMTGNVVFVGLGLAGGNDVPLLRASLALAGFVAGALVLGLVQRGRESRPNADPVAAATFVGAAVLTAGAAAALWTGDLSEPALDAVTAVLAFALGAQAVGARRVAVGDVSTVVVTSTLAGLAADGPWTGDRVDHATTARRLAAVLCMGAGAVLGAFLLRLDVAVAVLAAAVIMLAVGLVQGGRVWLERRRDRSGRRATASIAG